MKKIFIALCLCSGAVSAQTNWNDSPYNWNNSQYNFQNSPYNWNNSQYNWNNSQYKWNSRNGIYDNDGNRQGYVVPNQNGTFNYFDNDGNRRGYMPYGR